MHLQVGDIPSAREFYVNRLGFDETAVYGPQALFVSAGGYHHHLGLNTWRGEGVPPMPEGTVGLRHWTIVLDNVADVAAVRERLDDTEDRPDGFLARDPWNNAVVVRS